MMSLLAMISRTELAVSAMARRQKTSRRVFLSTAGRISSPAAIPASDLKRCACWRCGELMWSPPREHWRRRGLHALR